MYQFLNYRLGLHIEEQESLADLFWMQMRRFQPVTYLADCLSYVTMASNNKELFAVRQAIDKLPPAP